MKEGAEKKGGWKGLPFYTRVTIAGLLVFVLILTGLSTLAMVSVGGEDAVQGIVFYALAMIPTVVVIVLAWRRPGMTLVAAIWAMLGEILPQCRKAPLELLPLPHKTVTQGSSVPR